MPNSLYKIIHSSPELDTLSKYLSESDLPASNYAGDYNRFLSVKGEDGLTNADRIINSIKTADKRNSLIRSGILASDGRILQPEKLPLEVGTVFYIEFDRVNTISFLTEGLQVVSTDDVAFKAAQIAKLEADINYTVINPIVEGEFTNGSSNEMYPNLTVWIWCRALSSKQDESGELLGEIIDITQFVQKLQTNVGKSGGNFTITLPPLVAEISQDNKWIIKKSDITQFENGEYVAEGSLFDIDSSSNHKLLRRNQFFFKNAINPNDLVFLRFETLELEKQQRFTDAQNLYVDKKNLPDRIYDMIGLVDSATISINPSGNETSISIAGRDCSKLLLSDGTYFNSLENSNGIVRIAGGSMLKNSLLSRVMDEKSMKFIGLYNFTSIEKILKYIIQQLANIKIVPNDLFSAYGDRRNTRFNEINYGAKTDSVAGHVPQFKEDVSNGVWQIFKIVVDSSVSQRRIADTSYSMAQGALMNFIQTACQLPLVEAYFDTYGDQYHLIVRKPPYDQNALISLIEGKFNTEEGVFESEPTVVTISSSMVLQENLTKDDTQMYNWYHFFPKGAMINTRVDYSTYVTPAIFFDELAQIYGAKSFSQSHAYLPYVNNSFESEFGNLMYKQAFLDLKYVIESTQYLPFSRKGTIILNGDRRIKVGNIIRYSPTGEIFFVDAVQQNISVTENTIERTTVVQVSRGLVESFIYGKHLQDENGKEVYISYFNIIDTRLDAQEKSKSISYTETVKTGEETITVDDNGMPDGNTGTFSDVTLLYPQMVSGKKYLEKYTNIANKNLFTQFINQINKSGYEVSLTPRGTNRTAAEQYALKAENPLNAAAGSSRHEIGEAIDITITNKKNGTVCGQKTSLTNWQSTPVPELARSLGIQWGDERHIGQFRTKTGGEYVDRVHFQVKRSATSSTGKKTITRDILETQTKHKTVKEIDVDGAFKNFKVNTYTLNFFLKNLQFDPSHRRVTNTQVYNSDQEGSLPNVIITTKKKN